MKVSELVVRCLENEGVRYIFGIPGEENLSIIHAISSSEKINFILTRDERGASFMANTFGRLLKMPGVCLSTLGPGATNMVTGIADAYLDFSPVVSISGQSSLSLIHKESHQYIDIVSMMRPLTKWTHRLEKPETTPEVIRKAFRIASIEKPGPCHIEIPEDIADMEVDSEPIERVDIRYPGHSFDLLKKAQLLINDARMPVIIAGRGVIRGSASQSLRRFSSGLKIPVFETFMGMGAVGADSEMFVSTIGLQSKDYVSCGLERTDLIILIGFDPVEFEPSLFLGNRDVLYIGYTPFEPVSGIHLRMELTGDISLILSHLLEGVRKEKDPSYFLKLRGMVSNDFERKGFPLKPLRIVEELRKALQRNDILVSDVGAHKIWIARFYRAYEPDTVLISNGFASMGFSIPSAITAKLLFPQRNVIAVTGDGGFMMSLGELETAHRLGIKIICLVFNDGGYGMIEWKEALRYGSSFYAKFSNPDFVKLAESFGMKGVRVESEDDLERILKRSLMEDSSFIIDCPVDYRENILLTERLGSIICPV